MSEFKAEIKVEYFKRMIDSAVLMNKEARMDIGENGVSIKMADPANVCLVHTILKKESFKKYELDDPFQAGLNLSSIDFLNLVDSAGDITIEYDNETNRMIYNAGRFEYSVALLALDVIANSPKVPELEFPYEISLPGKELKLAIKAGKKITDCLTFKIDNVNFSMGGDSIVSNMNFVMPKTELENCIEKGEKGEEMKSMYDIDYLMDIIKVISDSEAVTLKLDNDYPMIVSQTFAEGNGELTYLMAPRVEDL